MRLLALSLLIVACGDGPVREAPSAPAPPAAKDAPKAPAARTSVTAHHDATPHVHAAGHGGEVRVVGELHVEGRFLKSGLLVWVTDAAQEPVDLATVTGSAVVKGPAGVTTVMLTSMGEHLHAAMTLPEGTAAEAVVTLSVAGKPVSVDFRTPAVGSLAAHDHTSLHGGVVSMWGDVHVEYVARAGEVRFYVTDVKRVPVAANVSGTVTFAGETVPLVFDPGTGALTAKATPTGLVMLDARVGGKAFSLAFGG